jgi:hypothetical protein
MAIAGVRTPVEQFIHDCSVIGRQGPPLTPKASSLSARAADNCHVPVICVDHGVYMLAPRFIHCLESEEYLNENFELMGGVYADGVKHSQWKQGLQLADGIGLACANISKSNGKYSADHHDTCDEEPCICQINSTGLAIMQCHTHRQTPHSFNHLSLAAYWYNFSSDLVVNKGSFFKNRAAWRKAIRPRRVLLDWMLLSYIYLEQEIRERAKIPTRFPYVAVGGTAPKLSAKKPVASTPKKAILDKDARSGKKSGSGAKDKRSGVKVIGGSTPRKAQKANGPGSGGDPNKHKGPPKGKPVSYWEAPELGPKSGKPDGAKHSGAQPAGAAPAPGNLRPMDVDNMNANDIKRALIAQLNAAKNN